MGYLSVVESQILNRLNILEGTARQLLIETDNLRQQVSRLQGMHPPVYSLQPSYPGAAALEYTKVNLPGPDVV